ncbi:hypothetical protein CWI37_0198p0030 [Hamiltosporidium tvaerminnensis]|uniref:Uncharacterized protein n=1 Tax=Hamiltosporidium tvaerminnensis TaxID=1176355 RepID=A0A4Q9LAY8_9MICR|nr:hypothetical protein CWI37_0198p0030 [Hamiltosporidium tvaerminnensis]
MSIQIKNLHRSKRTAAIFILLATHVLTSILTTVNFYIINEENRVKNYINSESTMDIMFKNEKIEYFDEINRITILKDNVLRQESKGGITKYYESNTVTLRYTDTNLLNSTLLKSLYISEKNIIRVFLKDVSTSNFLLFLKLIDNPDLLINQIDIKTFIDILTIITILDIKKSKQRNKIIKELLRNLVYGINIKSFNLENICCLDYTNNLVKRSIFRDLLIYFLEFVYFNEKRTRLHIVIKRSCDVIYKKDRGPLYEKSIKKSQKNKIYLKLKDLDVKKLVKIVTSYNLKNIWIFLFKIIRLDLLFFNFNFTETFEELIKLLSDVRFNSENFYLFCRKNASELLLKMENHIFLKNLKVLKFNFNFDLNELKQILFLYQKVIRCKINTNEINFETFAFLIDYCLKNPFISIKLETFFYKSDNTDLNVLKFMTKNLLFFPYLIKTGKYLTGFLDFSNTRSIKISTNNPVSPPLKIDDIVLNTLKRCKFLKYFSAKNIIISDELLIYILESLTLLSVEIKNLVYVFNHDLFSKIDTLNLNLKVFGLFSPRSCIKSNFMIYLAKFRSISHIKIENTEIFREVCSLEYFWQKICFFSKKNLERIFLEHLEIKYPVKSPYMGNCMYFMSKIYDFVNLRSIFLYSYILTEVDYIFFNKMNKLEVVTIEFISQSNKIDLKRLFKNSFLLNTVTTLKIYFDEITHADIQILKSFKNLITLSISLNTIDYKTIQNIKRKDFRTTDFVLEKPIRNRRSQNVNAYLDSEFTMNFP